MDFKDVKGNKVQQPNNNDLVWRPAVYGFLVKDNNLLCIKPAWDGKYALPGGAIEIGEEPIDSLKREFLEETAHTVDIVGEQPIYFQNNPFPGPTSKIFYHGLVFFYETKLISAVQEDITELGKEIHESCWKKISEIKLEEFTYFQRDFLQKMFKNGKHD